MIVTVINYPPQQIIAGHIQEITELHQPRELRFPHPQFSSCSGGFFHTDGGSELGLGEVSLYPGGFQAFGEYGRASLSGVDGVSRYDVEGLPVSTRAVIASTTPQQVRLRGVRFDR